MKQKWIDLSSFLRAANTIATMPTWQCTWLAILTSPDLQYPHSDPANIFCKRHPALIHILLHYLEWKISLQSRTAVRIGVWTFSHVNLSLHRRCISCSYCTQRTRILNCVLPIWSGIQQNACLISSLTPLHSFASQPRSLHTPLVEIVPSSLFSSVFCLHIWYFSVPALALWLQSAWRGIVSHMCLKLR